MTKILLILGLSILAGPVLAQNPPPIALEPVAEGLERPVFLTHAGDGSGRLFVLEAAGRIRLIKDDVLRPRPFLDIGERLRAGGERGLLGLAFHPDFEANRQFYVNYTRRSDGASVVSRFRARAERERMPETETVLLTIEQPFDNHNGGMLAFGPDGFLYIGSGDGGSGGDPRNNAQDPDQLLGKILRIDVDRGRPYAIPNDNPFADGDDGAREVFALGFRNPWRFSFDRVNGRLWVADVGQAHREEAGIVRVGRNYGWRIREGSRCFQPREGCRRRGLVDPLVEYPHTLGRCSITGGYVYRGRAIPELRSSYLYGDFCTGEIFARRRGKDTLLLDTGARIASFGEDEAGEVYVVDLLGTIYRIVPAG